ncbi:unnamed protein product [Pleuronectes platessa]|uniref:G-protein coupled receptors family 1 profile domain-containing protein n=1 Tax=Pleuronectes platessa TaxID=8262 RepID=A0A9N7YAK0_PLEPL|nr:unnamed protein product [Pleuronectes platessa]
MILQPRTLFVFLAHAHVLVSLRNNGEVRGNEGASVSAHSARTFHASLRESHQSRARERALSAGYATGASSAERAISRGTLNFTHPWRRASIAGETRRVGHNKRDFNRTVTPVEDPHAVAHWDATRRHSKRIKLNGALDTTRTPAGGHYNAAKPSSMGRGGGGLEEGDRHKRGTKDEQKKGWKRGRRLNKGAVPLAQPHTSPWEPIPKPVALTSTDMPFDLFTRRPELFTFREENPWDATPITPPSSPDFGGDEIKNPFYPVTSETYGAYAITCVSGVIFLVGIAGNIAILCIVCQNYYMKSISNSLLANLAVWDFVLILFCLPMVVFHELTKSWLLGEFTCKVVPYVETETVGCLCHGTVGFGRQAGRRRERGVGGRSRGGKRMRKVIDWQKQRKRGGGGGRERGAQRTSDGAVCGFQSGGDGSTYISLMPSVFEHTRTRSTAGRRMVAVSGRVALVRVMVCPGLHWLIHHQITAIIPDSGCRRRGCTSPHQYLLRPN